MFNLVTIPLHHAPEEEITKFDIAFAKAGREGEPGEAPDSPYKREHTYATAIEYSLCKELGLDPTAYDRYLNEYITRNME